MGGKHLGYARIVAVPRLFAMAKIDHKRAFEEVLTQDNQQLLLKAATGTFVNVVATAHRAGLIELDPEYPKKLEPPNELADTRALFQEGFSLKGEPARDPVRFESLGHEYRRHRGLSEPYTNLFRLRSQQVPKLFAVLREYRNMLQHSFDDITPGHFAGLCGTVLSVLDVAPQDVSADGLRELCERGVRDLAVALTRPDGEGHEATDGAGQAKRGRSTTSVESLGRRTSSSPDPLEKALGPLVRMMDAISTKLDRIEELAVTVAPPRDAPTDRKRDQWVVQTSATDSRYSDNEPMVTIDAPATEQVDVAEVGRLTPAMAKQQLREFRDRISRENPRLKSWENICMVSPIVDAAVQAASEGRLESLDDWRSLPAVRAKFDTAESTQRMEEQLARYGAAMMTIYSHVERQSADSVKFLLLD